MKTYDYLVAYKWSAEGYLTPCDGTVVIHNKKKIKSGEDLEKIKQYIENILLSIDKSVHNVSIYNFILLGRNKHKKS